MTRRLFLPLLVLVLGLALFVQATVNEVTARNDYTANGSTTAFTYSWRILTKSDIEVLVNGVVKTVDTDYSVTGLGASGGGTVTFTVAPANGLKVALLRKQPAQQTSIYLPNAPLNTTRLEQDLDKLQMQVQQLKEQLQRIPAFEKKSLLKDKVLPDFGAGKFLRANDAGTGLEWVTPVTVGTLNVPSFTTGSVPFATGTATLGQDNANLFWDDANNRLGIGTATPGTPLHVPGTSTLVTIAGPTATTGTWTFGGTATSTKGCAAGFARILPNYCVRTTPAAVTGLVDATACTARSADIAIGSDAKLTYFILSMRFLSNNATGLRANQVSFWKDAACSDPMGSWRPSVREEVAVAAATNLGDIPGAFVLEAASVNPIFYTTQENAGGNGNGDLESLMVLGYFD